MENDQDAAGEDEDVVSSIRAPTLTDRSTSPLLRFAQSQGPNRPCLRMTRLGATVSNPD